MDIHHTSYIMQEMNNQRLSGSDMFCDIVLTSSGHRFHAHKSVLAVVCPYFQVKFKNTSFSDSTSDEQALPDVDPEHAQSLLDYIYTGNIHFTVNGVEDILILADFLCIDDLKAKCGHYLASDLTKENCLWIKCLADQYSVFNLQNNVVDFMSPIFHDVIQSDDVMDLCLSDVTRLLSNEQLIYIEEHLIWELITSWVNYDRENRKKYYTELIKLTNPALIDGNRLQHFLKDIEFASALSHNEEKLKAANAILSKTESAVLCDVIVVRSRQLIREEPVKLLAYVINDNSWREFEYNRSWEGIESIIFHDDTLYALCKIQDDTMGYMHMGEEKFEFLKLLPFGLTALPAPHSLRGRVRLVSMNSKVIAIDSYGSVELFDEQWYPLIDRVSPAPCQFFLPMPRDQDLLLLRGSCFSDDTELTLIEINLRTKTHHVISETYGSELNVGPNERFHGYSVTPSCLMIHNEMGRARIKYDFISDAWITLPRQVPYLRCISDIWGSSSCRERAYLVCRMNATTATQLMMYDYPTARFKSLTQPLFPLSGIMCAAKVNVREFVEGQTLVM